MNILFLLIGVSLLAALIFLGLFIWAVRNGQYEDSYTPSVRILFEEDDSTNQTEEQTSLSARLEKTETKKN